MLISSRAPAPAAAAAGSLSQMSSQMVMPTGNPLIGTTQGSLPVLK